MFALVANKGTILKLNAYETGLLQAFSAAGDRLRHRLPASRQPPVGRLRRRRGLPVTWSPATDRVGRRALGVDVSDGGEQVETALLRRRSRGRLLVAVTIQSAVLSTARNVHAASEKTGATLSTRHVADCWTDFRNSVLPAD